jgi:Effector-associated domain 9
VYPTECELDRAHSARRSAGVPSKRLARLEREYDVVSEQIANSTNAADISRLKKHRDAIVTEAREIIRKLNLPEPDWTRKKI